MARRPNRAEQRAIDLLSDHHIDEIPVPVDKLARQLAVNLQYEPLEGGLSAVLYQGSDGRRVIGVNSSHAPVRQRFSIAHEIGHLCMHKDVLFVDGLVRRDDTSSVGLDPREIEANAFAAELLMPRDPLLEEVRSHVPDGAVADPRRLTRKLAQKFEVSEQAMEYRLVNLGLSTSF